MVSAHEEPWLPGPPGKASALGSCSLDTFPDEAGN